jgi:hypothetical protein
MKDGIAGLDRYGVDKALWFGLPGLAKWSKTGMKEGRSPLAPEGTVGHFDRYEQLAAWSRDDQRALRVTVLDHDNDPIAVLAPRLMVRRPDWLLDHHRGRNVPESMSWIPIITFVQTAADAMNAMRTVPGEFKSFGHDYRADTARFVHTAFDLQAVTDEQMASVERVLREIEIERGARIAAARQHAESATQAQEAEAPHAPAGPSGASTADAPAHGERHRLHGRTHGAHWGRSLRRTRRGLDQRAAAG